jgi:hypothetical protein
MKEGLAHNHKVLDTNKKVESSTGGVKVEKELSGKEKLQEIEKNMLGRSQLSVEIADLKDEVQLLKEEADSSGSGRNFLGSQPGHDEIIRRREKEILEKEKEIEKINKLLYGGEDESVEKTTEQQKVNEKYRDDYFEAMKHPKKVQTEKEPNKPPLEEILKERAAENEKKIAKFFKPDESTTTKNYANIEDDKEIDLAKPETPLPEPQKPEQPELDPEQSAPEVPKPEESLPEVPEPIVSEPGENSPSPEERKTKIEQLKQKLDQDRKDYLEVDYKKNKVYKRLYNKLGSIFKGRKEGDGDLAYYRGQYDNTLFDYKNAVLEDAKSRGASNKELGEILKLFTVEANLNIADGHDAVKFEHHEGKFAGFLKNKGTEMIEWYKKMPWAKKIAIGAAFGLGALALGNLGAAAAGVATSAVTLRRIFMGMVTGTTVSLTAEKITRKRTEKRVNKEADVFAKQLEGLSDEEKFRLINHKIDGVVYDEDRKINKIKNKNLRNLSMGVLAGTIVGSGALSDLFKSGWSKAAGFFGHHAEVPTSISGASGGKPSLGMEDFKKTFGIGAEHSEFAPPANNITQQGFSPAEATAPGEIFGNAIETAKPGDSVWKMAERQLEQQLGEKFTDLEGPEKTHIIDAIKDRIVANPQAFGLNNPDQISVGQKIDFSNIFGDKTFVDNAFDHGSNLSDEAYSNIANNNEYIQHWVESHPGESLTSEKVSEILGSHADTVQPESPSTLGAEHPAPGSAIAGSPAEHHVPAPEHVAETVSPEQLKDVRYGLNELTSSGDPYMRGQNWDAISQLKVDDAMKTSYQPVPGLGNSILRMEDNYGKVIGADAKHRAFESIEDWVKRITRAAAEKGK